MKNWKISPCRFFNDIDSRRLYCRLTLSLWREKEISAVVGWIWTNLIERCLERMKSLGTTKTWNEVHSLELWFLTFSKSGSTFDYCIWQICGALKLISKKTNKNSIPDIYVRYELKNVFLMLSTNGRQLGVPGRSKTGPLIFFWKYKLPTQINYLS